MKEDEGEIGDEEMKDVVDEDDEVQQINDINEERISISNSDNLR